MAEADLDCGNKGGYGMVREEPWLEYSAPLPADLVEKSAGIAFDFGGSCVKCIFKPKKAAPEENNHFTTVHLITTDGYKSIAEVLQYVQQVASLPEPGATVHSIGIEQPRHRQTVEDTLNIKLEHKSEVGCFIKAPEWVIKDPHLRQHWVDPLDSSAVTSQLTSMAPLYKEEVKLPEYEGPGDENDDPFFIVMLGSGIAIIKIQNDLPSETIQIKGNGSLTFQALSQIIFGEKLSNREIMKRVCKGNERNIDMYIHEQIKEMGQEAELGFLPDLRNFPLSKKISKPEDDYKADDIVRSLLLTFIQNLVYDCFLHAHIHNVKRIYFFGGFVTHEFIRTEMSRAFAYNAIIAKYQMKQTVPRPYFLRFPSFLGGIGALLYDDISVQAQDLFYTPQ